jgi:hypothetical protein
MLKEKSEIIEEIEGFLTEDKDHYFYEDSHDEGYAHAKVSCDHLLTLLRETPAKIEWDGKATISLLPNKELGFRFELEFDCYHWRIISTLSIDELSWSYYDGYKGAYNKFKYLLDQGYENEKHETLMVYLNSHTWDESNWDERYFVEQMLVTHGVSDKWVFSANIDEIVNRLTRAIWLNVHVDDTRQTITVHPDPGFGSPVTLNYDKESCRLFSVIDDELDYDFFYTEHAFGHLLKYLNAESTDGLIHRQSIYLKNESESTNTLMDTLMDKSFRDSDEECFVKLLLRERNVPGQWFSKLSPNYEGLYIRKYRENTRDNLFELLHLQGIPIVILSIGFISSIVIFIMFFLGRYEPATTYWSTIGPIIAIAHLVAVLMVAFLCFDDLVLDMRHDDIGPVSHQIGWFSIATACFPVGYPIGVITKIIAGRLVERFESELEGRSRERIIYNLNDLTGPIPMGRIWIPMVLYGTIGTAYWIYLPNIFKWVLS